MLRLCGLAVGNFLGDLWVGLLVVVGVDRRLASDRRRIGV